LDFKNGPKWTLGTPLDESPKKIPAFFLYSYNVSKSMKFSRSPNASFSFEILKLKPSTTSIVKSKDYSSLEFVKQKTWLESGIVYIFQAHDPLHTRSEMKWTTVAI
jgi:hypothetical protein